LKKKKELMDSQKARDELAQCTFKPEMMTNSHKLSLEKTTNSEKPKGFDDHVRRVRNGTRETFRKKYLKNR
jgi:hypothetical protein